jgi:hypothetical protein
VVGHKGIILEVEDMMGHLQQRLTPRTFQCLGGVEDRYGPLMCWSGSVLRVCVYEHSCGVMVVCVCVCVYCQSCGAMVPWMHVCVCR